MSDSSNFAEVFLQEAEELLADIEECILNIESDPEDHDAINRLFRAMHTIKGSGSMFGFDDIADFTHHVETALDLVREGKMKISKTFIDLILMSRDQISAMLDQSQGGPSVSHVENLKIIEKFHELMPRSARSSSKNADEKKKRDEAPPPSKQVYRVRFGGDSEMFSRGMDPALLIDELRGLGECEVIPNTDSIPSLDEIDPEKCYLSWDIVLTTEKGEDEIHDVFIFVEDDCEIDIRRISEEEAEDVPRLGEILVERGDAQPEDIEQALNSQKRLGDLLSQEKGVSKQKIQSALQEQKALQAFNKAAARETVRVPADKLDNLINLVGELVITQAQLSRVATKIDSLELDSPVEEVDRLTGELRDIVLNIRMMPIGGTFSRFRRLVRDLSSELNKKIDLVTLGGETEMDKTVIDRLGDPLVHLIRNSLDHGIESAEKRREAEKPEKGTIRLSATHRGANVVISIEDDGQGLNADSIRAKAIEKGLIAATDDLSEKEIFNLIMQPGFSTAESVTSISGRGVGMDVVKREIESLRGSIEIDSQLGKGTRIDLYLPLTLAIIDGLLVEIGAGKYVIPINAIVECLEMTDETVALDRGRNLIQVRGELLPFVRLRETFWIEGVVPEIEEAVIVNHGDNRVGLVVDRVIGDYQTVIKSLGRIYQDVEGLSGATIMGDGNVALIVDVLGLVRMANMDEKHSIGKIRKSKEKAETVTAQS